MGLLNLRKGTVILSDCGKYRYLLTRKVGIARGICTFVMLNPSTADAVADDPTIRKCVGFAKRLDCGTLQVLNLFAYRATDPKVMVMADDPVGPDNERTVKQVITGHRGPVICAWGTLGGHRGQDKVMLKWLRDAGVKPVAYALTRGGHPRHPLYLPYGDPPSIVLGDEL